MTKQKSSYKDFYNDYNKGLSRSVLFFYGEENFLMKWACDTVISKEVTDEERAFGLVELPGDECTIDQIIQTAMTSTMFGNKRIVLIKDFKPLYSAPDRNAQKFIEDKLLAFAENRSEDYIVIFTLDSMHQANMTALAKKFAAIKQSGYEFPRLERGELRAFIRKRINDAGKYIDDRTLDELIEISGYYLKESRYTLSEFENDLIKLTNAAEDKIGSDLAWDVMVGEGEKYVFTLIDSIMGRDVKKAMTIVQNILSDDEYASMRIISLLTSQFEMMFDSKKFEQRRMSLKDMARELGVNEYRFQRAFNTARSFSEEYLRKALLELYEIDKKIKMGDIDKDVALETFVLSR